jgi:L-aspartate oxidase
MRAGEFRLKAEATENVSVVSGFSRNAGLPPAPEAARALMWAHAGLFRDADGLRLALERLGDFDPGEDTRVTVGRLIARAALRREESRGGHYRLDFPARDDQRWRRRLMETRTTE